MEDNFALRYIRICPGVNSRAKLVTPREITPRGLLEGVLAKNVSGKTWRISSRNDAIWFLRFLQLPLTWDVEVLHAILVRETKRTNVKPLEIWAKAIYLKPHFSD